MYKRILNLPLSTSETCFLWGPRQTGKSTLLKAMYPDAKRYDLLLSDQYQRLLLQPSLIREECLAIDLKGENQTSPIIIDEVQKIPIPDEPKMVWKFCRGTFFWIVFGLTKS